MDENVDEGSRDLGKNVVSLLGRLNGKSKLRGQGKAKAAIAETDAVAGGGLKDQVCKVLSHKSLILKIF